MIGYSEGDIRDISFSDVLFDWTDGGYPSSEAKEFTESASGASPDAPVYVECADNVTFDQFRIRWKTQDPAWKYGLRTERCRGTSLYRSDFGKANLINGKIDQ